jgi:hypothetical protein
MLCFAGTVNMRDNADKALFLLLLHLTLTLLQTLLLPVCTDDQIEWPDRYVGWIADDWYDYESEHESVDFETQLMALQVCANASVC